MAVDVGGMNVEDCNARATLAWALACDVLASGGAAELDKVDPAIVCAVNPKAKA